MNWFLPIVMKWLDELAKERKFSPKVVEQTQQLLTRLHGLVVNRQLEIPVPSVENEPVPATESAQESAPALTWLGPFGRLFQLMYLEKSKRVMLRFQVGEQEEIEYDPTDEMILTALGKMGAGVPKHVLPPT